MNDNASTEPAAANGVMHRDALLDATVSAACESTDARMDGTTSTSDTPEFNLLTEGQHYVRKWQPRLRLTDWDVWVEVAELANSHWGAQSDKEWRMRRAHITLPPDFLQKMKADSEVLPEDSDSQIVEQSVLHELLHILEEPEASHVNDDVIWFFGDRDNGGVVSADFRNAWRDYREWWINHVARALLEAERTHGWTD